MSNVVDLQARMQKRRQGEGEVTFVLCGCTDEPEPVIPVVLHDAQGPLIVALMCPSCEREMAVINGRLGNGE